MNYHKEIERKYLVTGNFKKHAKSSTEIKQGFLSTDPERMVRVRLVGNKSFLTIKGGLRDSGTTRLEWEKEIEAGEAENLIRLCKFELIHKTRYFVNFEGLIFEVDEFHGKNKGLIIAEVELKSADQQFKKPEWLGKEITGENKYYNVHLIKKPYSSWCD